MSSVVNFSFWNHQKQILYSEQQSHNWHRRRHEKMSSVVIFVVVETIKSKFSIPTRSHTIDTGEGKRQCRPFLFRWNKILSSLATGLISWCFFPKRRSTRIFYVFLLLKRNLDPENTSIALSVFLDFWSNCTLWMFTLGYQSFFMLWLSQLHNVCDSI